MKVVSLILLYFLLFISYSFIGWIIESIFCSVNEKKINLNRGFLIGPYLPIFGFGALIIIIFFNKYANDLLALFVISSVTLTTLEYITSYAMEKLFKARWWNYYDHKFNINGRVSLTSAVGFGILSIVLVCMINPIYMNLLSIIPTFVLNTISIILLIIFLTDFCISLKIILDLNKSINNIKTDITNEISAEVKRILKNRKPLTKRLLNAFPGTEFDIKKIKLRWENIKNKQNKTKKLD